MTNINVGSTWKKWDLHVHAPTAVFANEFEGKNEDEKWQKYLEALKALDDVSVLGITDYWSLDGYKKVLEHKNEGNLNNIDLILPNIELRLSTFTPAGRAVNFHCIFNPDYVDKIENRFFGKLVFKPRETPYTCKKEDLIDLGREHTGNTRLDENAAYKEGCNQFKVSHTDLQKLFTEDSELRRNSFLVIPNSSEDGNSGNQDSNYEATRQSIYRFVDAIFDGNPSSISHFLGKREPDNKEEIIRKYGNLKPCINGSDAHSNPEICKPSKDRFTWIKTTCSFNGLKQIIFEPANRVYIGEIKPDTKNTYQTIKSVKIKSDDFIDEEIPINRNLTTIIGGKSTGKSLLLYYMDKTADKEEVSSRLKEMGRAPSYKDLTEFDLILTWADDTTSTLSKTTSEDNNFQTAHKITYIPQSYLNYIAEHQKDTVDKIIEKVLLQNKETKAAYEVFKKNKQEKELSLEIKIAELFSIYEQGRTAKQEAKNIGNKEGIEKYLLKLHDEIKMISTKYGFTDEKIKKKENLENERIDREQRINKLELDKENIKLLVENLEENVDFSSLKEEVDGLSELSYSQLNHITDENIKKFFNEIKLKYSEYKNTIPAKITKLKEQVKSIDKELMPLRSKASKQSGLEDKQKAFLLEKEKLEKINNYYDQIKKLTESYQNTKEKILECYKSVHGLYGNLIEKLETAKSNLTDVELEISLDYDRALFNESFYRPLIDKRSEELEQVLPAYDQSHPEKHFQKVSTEINNILSSKHKFHEKTPLEDALKRYLRSYFYIDYKIKYHNDEFDKMSTGKSSLVLLKLLIDLDDSKHPILLDQPEDDLDNRSIYNDLVEFICEKKKDRQIIIVTHNPNIVVGTDSEQVIVANQKGQGQGTEGQDKRFEYAAGAIENNFVDEDAAGVLDQMGIREHICQILEGGKDAFKKREQRYNLQKN